MLKHSIDSEASMEREIELTFWVKELRTGKSNLVFWCREGRCKTNRTKGTSLIRWMKLGRDWGLAVGLRCWLMKPIKKRGRKNMKAMKWGRVEGECKQWEHKQHVGMHNRLGCAIRERMTESMLQLGDLQQNLPVMIQIDKASYLKLWSF